MAVLGRFVGGVLLIQRCPPSFSRARWHCAQGRGRREESLMAGVKELDMAGYVWACLRVMVGTWAVVCGDAEVC